MFKLKQPMILLIMLFCQQTFSQISTNPSLGWSTFVKGMTGVENHFTIPDNNYDEVYLVFNGANSHDSVAATLNSNVWELSYDMGTLADETVSVSLYAFNASGQEIDSQIDFNQLSFLRQPVWLSNMYNGILTVTSVNDANNTIDFDAELPLKSVFNDVVPNSVKGIGDKALDISATLHFSGTYTISNHATDCPNNPEVKVSLTFVAGTEEFTLPINSQIVVDDSLNPILTITEIKDFGEFSRSFPISKIPLVFPVCLSLDANFSVNPKIKGQIVLGMDNGEWGFVDNNGEKTSILGKVRARASINGSVQALCGIKRSSVAKGALGLEANIGGGASYTTASGVSTQFGGDFRVYGSLSFPWPFRKYSIHESTLYGPVDFGDTTGLSFKVASTPDSIFGSWATTSETIEIDSIPEAWPFGNLSARDSGLVIGWIDDVNSGAESAKVQLAYYDSYNNTFDSPVQIVQNDNGIHNLSLALLPDGNTALTWVQSRYTNSQINSSSLSMDAVMASEDLFVALYNPSTGQISKERIVDDISQNQSGRSEGNPKIVWGNGNSGLIVWEVADNIGSDIYFCTISENSGALSISTPAPINNTISGLNYNPQIAYSDATHALALWINDADDDDSTSNTVVYESTWDGNNWSAPSIHYNLPAGTEAKELSIQTNGLYGIEAITYQGYLGNDDNLVNGVAIGIWDNGDPNNAIYQVEEDSLFYFQIPKASISANGIASIVLQVRDVTDPEDEGSLEMYLKDIVNGTIWTEVSETSQSNYLHYLNDTLNTVWEMSNTFGYYSGNGSKDILYLLTQESDTADNTVVSYGSILSNPNLHMVLRAFEVESNGGNITLQDVQEPEDTAIYNNIVAPDYLKSNFTLSQNEPNPFSDYTKIRFSLPNPATVSLEIWDNLGRLMNTPVHPSLLGAGHYITDYHSGNLPAGIYHYRLKVNNESITRHMVIER